jgi:hypothetical protein
MKATTSALTLVCTLFLTGSPSGAVESTSKKTPGLAMDAGISGSIAPTDWKAWAEWAEKLRPVTDNQGHGPDIGSDEWAGALGKQLDIGGVAGSKEWRKAVEKKLTAKEKPAENVKRELLSSHDTEASFVGLKDHRCMGLTSLCPDQCGESGKLATFMIDKYLDYKKPGEYGDPKQEEFMVLIENNMRNAKVTVAIRDAILALKPGDKVHLKWNHDYVTKDGSSYPDRPIVTLKPIKEKPAK